MRIEECAIANSLKKHPRLAGAKTKLVCVERKGSIELFNDVTGDNFRKSLR